MLCSCLLKGNYSESNLDAVMCRTLLSVDWRGYLYDCDFKQMLALPMRLAGNAPHLRDLLHADVVGSRSRSPTTATAAPPGKAAVAAAPWRRNDAPTAASSCR